MVNAKKTQIALIALGLLVAGLGIYLTFSSVTYYVTGIITIGGLGIVRWGYKRGEKRESTRVETQTTQTSKIRTDGEITTLAGIVIFLVSLGLGSVAMLAHAGLFALLCFFFALVGAIVVFVGNILKIGEKISSKHS